MSTAIKLKQLANEAGDEVSSDLLWPFLINSFLYLMHWRQEFRVCVIEKAASVGGHILSGACLEPRLKFRLNILVI